MVGNVSTQELADSLWDYMKYEQALQKADVIIGLGSHDLKTAYWCAHLYKQGWAKKVLFTGGAGRFTREKFTDSEADTFANHAIELGVPRECILRERKSTNTGENIVYSKQLLEAESIAVSKIILVTKPYMLRRAYATFMKQWPSDNKPEIICSSIDLNLMDYCEDRDDDFGFEAVVNTMVGDLQRIIEYPKKGFQIELDVPSEIKVVYNELIERGFTKQLLQKVETTDAS